MRALSHKYKHEIAEFTPGSNQDKLVKCLEDTNVLVIPRPVEGQFISLMEELKKNGVKVAVDHDDNMMQISPLSPHYEGFGVENVKFIMPDGTEKVIWKDGDNLKIQENKERIENFKKALGVASVVSVTQPILAEKYAPYSNNIKVLPNCIDPTVWQKLPLKPHKGIRVGWAGGHSHYEDWMLLEEVLPEVMNKYPEMVLVVLGQLFTGALKKCPRERIEHHQWVHTQGYPYKMAILDLDFSLIPLVDNEFNRCKSNIKWVESGSLQVPAVTSLVSPYKEWYDGENGVFIENNDPQAWIDGISFMIENAKDREQMGRNSHKTVLDNFNIWDKCHLWAEAYQ